MPTSPTVRKLLFAAGVLGCLGFGSAQAFAAPRDAAPAAMCNDTVCAATCIAKGYWGGYCGTLGCTCYRIDS